MPTQQDDALDAFIEHITNIIRHLHNLSTLADEHFGYHPDHIDWTHVGTVTHVDEQLEEIWKSVSRKGVDKC